MSQYHGAIIGMALSLNNRKHLTDNQNLGSVPLNIIHVLCHCEQIQNIISEIIQKYIYVLWSFKKRL